VDVSVSDLSELEPGEDNRVIRKTITFSVFGHIFTELIKVPVVHTVNISVRDLKSDEEYDSISIDGGVK
jgi:hypothetical protein